MFEPVRMIPLFTNCSSCIITSASRACEGVRSKTFAMPLMCRHLASAEAAASRSAPFKNTLGLSRFPYFELLLKTSWVKGTPIASNMVAYRIYPKYRDAC